MGTKHTSWDILLCGTCGAILHSVNQDTAKSEIIDVKYMK